MSQPAKQQQKPDRFIELMVSCVNPCTSSARDFKKYILDYSYKKKIPDIQSLEAIRSDLAAAHHLVCDMIQEANRIDYLKNKACLPPARIDQTQFDESD